MISSHILDELSKFATHYGFVDAGRIVKEISAEELEKACRKCTRLGVSSTAVLSRVLDEMGAQYKIISVTEADVYAKVNLTQLISRLSAEDCELISASEREESLESYYVNLVGGGRNE